MSTDNETQDPSILLDPVLSASLSLTPKPNAMFVPLDDTGTRNRIVWLDDEKARVNKFLADSINGMIADHAAVWSKRALNKRAYEALAVEGEAITLPYVRQYTNQQHAYLIDTLFSRTPWLDVQALGARKYTVVHKDPDTGLTKPKQVTATEEAKVFRDLINFKWTYRLPMRRIISDWTMEGLQDGNLPAVVKLCHYDPADTYNTRKIRSRTPDLPIEQNPSDPQSMVTITNATDTQRVGGETIRIVTVPSENLLVPFSARSLDDASIVAERCEEPVRETHRKLVLGYQHRPGGYDFCLPDDSQPQQDLIESVLYGTEKPDDSDAQSPRKSSKPAREASRRKELSPDAVNVIYECYYKWPVLTPEVATSPDGPVIEWVSVVSDFHLKRKEVLNAVELDNWAYELPYVDFFMRPRPNSYSGTCVVDDVAPFQRYASQLFHLHIQNLVMQNVAVFFVRKGSSAATSLRGRKLRPGMLVEFDEPDDVAPKPLGTPSTYDITRDIMFLKTGAQEASVVTQYDQGTADLSRVTSGAFDAQQNLAKMQPQQVYDNLCDAVSRLALRYVQYLIQYAPEQTLPSFGEEADAIIDNILHLPREMVTRGDFHIYPVATPKDETMQAESQRDLQISMAISKANEFLLQMWGDIARQGVPPPFVMVGLKAIARTEKILGELISHTRHDSEDYVIEQEWIENLIHQLLTMMPQPGQQPGGQPGGQPPAGGPSAPGQPALPPAPPPNQAPPAGTPPGIPPPAGAPAAAITAPAPGSSGPAPQPAMLPSGPPPPSVPAGGAIPLPGPPR